MKTIQQLSKNEQQMVFESLIRSKNFQDVVSCFFEGVARFTTDSKEFRTTIENEETCIVRAVCKQKANGSQDFIFVFYPVNDTKASNGVSNICKLRILHDLSMQSKDPFSSILLMLNDDWWFSGQAKELIRKHSDIDFKSDQELNDYINHAPYIRFEELDDASIIKHIIP